VGAPAEFTDEFGKIQSGVSTTLDVTNNENDSKAFVATALYLVA